MIALALLTGLLALVSDPGSPVALPPDPADMGPFAYAAITVTVTSLSTGDRLPTTIFYPAANGGVDPSLAPCATIVFAPAFLAQPGYYDGRGRHLASLGYIVAIPRFPNEDLEARAADIQYIFTYLETENARTGSPFYGQIDTAHFGLAGHSLGGVGTLMVAARDARIRAGVALDPIDAPAALLNQVTPPLAAARGNLLRAALSMLLRRDTRPAAVLKATTGPAAWDYTTEAPHIQIPMAVMGAPNPCGQQMANSANYKQLYPAIGSLQRALYVLAGGYHCDFMYTDNTLAQDACFLACGGGGSYSRAREQLVERYLTAWFNYYLRGQVEDYAYVYGAGVAADVAAGTITYEAQTAPRSLAAESDERGIALSWTAPDAAMGYGVISGYNVYRSEDAAGYPSTPCAKLGRVASYLDQNVIPGRLYYYRITSRDAAGNEHQPSAAVSASYARPLLLPPIFAQ